MKKVLLGATALSILGFAGAASAQEWSARVGGFMTTGFGYIDADETINNTEASVVNNAEVIINYRLVADNGITFGAKVEFEANAGSGNSGRDRGTVDEYVGFAQGSFGRVEIGAEDGAHDILVGGVPGGNFTSSADGGGFLFDYNDIGLGINTQGADTGDGLKVTYYTPTFSGFTAGVSYSPDGREGAVATRNIGAQGEGIEFGARFQENFGDFAVRVAGGYTYFDSNAATFEDSYTLAASLGFAGFTVGGIWGSSDGNGGNADREGFGIGGDYKTGPWYFGIQYGQMTDGAAEDNWGINGEVNYALAPGVTLGGVVEYGSFDSTPAGVDDDAWAAGVFMGFNF